MSGNTDINLAEVEAMVREIGSAPRYVIPILQAIQERYHYLPEAALRHVCRISEITPAAISGVATFYSQFRLKPAGRYKIKLCVGTACHVMGAETLHDTFRQELEIPDGQDTDARKLFTIEKVACLGCCMLAPAAQIENLTYGSIQSAKVPGVLGDFLASRQEPGVVPGEKNLPRLKDYSGEVRMCQCSSCLASGAGKVFAEIRRQIARHHLPARLKAVGCTGIAYQTPLVEIALNNGRTFHYGRLRTEQVAEVLLQHFRPASLIRRGGAAISGYLERALADSLQAPVTRYLLDPQNGAEAGYLAPQQQIVTRFSGKLDPLNLEEYRRVGGFEALQQCLEQLSQNDILEAIEESGLRGRGGGGFPTGKKWRVVAGMAEPVKYVVCNGDEGDPGAFMDRMILESFPFRVIEGMLIAAVAVGAREGIFYIRAEYPLAVRRIEEALRICRDNGLLGDNILNSGRGCQLSIAAGAGAFVCGEETALLASIQGERGTPHIRPPYPAQEGLWGKPTLVNNVETLAAVPAIIRDGPAVFAGLGTPTSKGTKTFALAGKVVRSGLIEVPMGLTLRQIVEDIGGGVRGGHRLKAIQIGGPSGGCVPAALADTAVDYEALRQAGAIMGSGGMVVLDESDCMVDMARYFMAFTQAESCGKCTFCRIGTKRMLEILERLCSGQGQEGDIEKLEELSKSVTAGSLCGLGKTAPNPVLTTIRYFREEYQAHVEGRCPTGKCRNMITYRINERCIGCTKCAQECPVAAIPVSPYAQHQIDPDLCTKCDRCRQVCPVDAIEVA